MGQQNNAFVVRSLRSLGLLYVSQGKYEIAIPLLEEALAMNKAFLGNKHKEIATNLNDLGTTYNYQGRYAEAELLLKEALEVHKISQDDRTEYLKSNLAGLFNSQGRYQQAEVLQKELLEIRKVILGDYHEDIASNLNDLAVSYRQQGRYEESELRHKEALVIRKKILGSQHPLVAQSLHNLAVLYDAQRRYKEAESLFKEALLMRKSVLGDRHPLVASSLHALAIHYNKLGYYQDSKSLFNEALEINKTVLGNRHPHVAQILNSSAELALSQGDLTRAIRLYTENFNIEESNLSNNLIVGTEVQKYDYIATLFGNINHLISLHLQLAPNNAKASHLALTGIFQRKGRILDSLTDNFNRLQQNLNSDLQGKLNQLANLRSQQSTLLYSNISATNPTQYRVNLKNLKQKSADLEAELNLHSTTFRQQNQAVTIEAIQNKIPANTTLIELIRYKPYNSKAKLVDRYGNPHYAAYLLTKDGKIDAIDLGEAAPIDQLAAKFRRLIQNPSIDIKPIARQLDIILMQPIRAKLAPNQHLLLSPDSYLNLIPFAALVDENNRYLLETTEISYLSSGRDLLHRNKTSPTLQPSLILANPNYKTAIATPSQPQSEQRATQRSNQRTTDLSKFIFSPLPGTAEEATAIAPKLSGATLLTEAQATETALKATRSPRILHIATHGFFLQDKPTATPKSSRSLDRANVILDINDLPLPTDRPYNPNDNPLLRSGLALAGANTLNGGNPDSDGILTALEASNLNLRGTQLVVLSACETGLGDIANGEGVYGLRRAFTLAGAETQLISLWKVSDNGTKDLMVNYYDKLLSGTGRSQSLLETQRKLLADPQYRHPYYWAPFILSGDWTPLHYRS